MSESTAHHLAAAMYLAPALVWGILARQYWGWALLRRFRNLDVLLNCGMASLITLLFALAVVLQLLPPALAVRSSPVRAMLVVVQDVSWVAVVALFRHSARYASVIREPIRRGWVAANYGACAVAGTVILVADLGFVPPGRGWTIAAAGTLMGYMVGMVGLATRSLLRHARSGAWTAAGVGEPRRLDGVLLTLGTTCILASIAVAVAQGAAPDRLLLSGPTRVVLSIAGLQAVAGLVFATPLVARLVGTVVEQLLVAVSVAGTAAAVLLGSRALGDRLAESGLRPLVDVASVVALIALLGPGRMALTAAIEWAVFRRSRQRRAEIDALMRAITPELGTVECCRRALAAILRVAQFRGAAILLQSGESVVDGNLAIAPLVDCWPRGAGASWLPTHVSLGDEIGLTAPALLDALIAADVALVLPIMSGGRRWGDLFVSVDLLTGSPLTLDQAEAWDAFGAQLGRVLDGADLLARAVAVERSLAHAEKLAAIGETAARIAHEIRNPVTAARSLAQQLARDPTSPADAEPARLILSELERVERQVAALLRFSRREEFHFAPVDLSALVRTTLTALAPRLETAGIDVALDLADGVSARADAEKLRQVLINLVENAIDALGDAPAPRRLSVGVGGINGTATLRVADTGPGVPADALPHLFEPFFSRKEKGTGLGLAIVKRTIDAHGGWIAAACEAGSGMTFDVSLPIVVPTRGRTA
jgi:signal transduction histidine kinase